MARPQRLDPEMGIHHVFTRGTKRWTIFHDDADRRRFIGQLSLVCDRYDVAVLAFALMDNHLHLVLRCPHGGISAALRDLKSGYARWFNNRHRSSGPLFENRFGSKLVTSHRQIRTLVRYVHRNPLDIDAAMDLARYPWSSHGMYAGLRPAPVWLHMNIARPLFTDYRAEVERPLSTDAVHNPWPNRQPASDSHQASVQVPGTWTLNQVYSLSDIVIAVAQAAGKPVADIQPTRRNGLAGVAAVIAVRVAGYAPMAAFEPLGYHRYNTFMKAISRTERRLQDDPQLAEVRAAALHRLQRQAA